MPVTDFMPSSKFITDVRVSADMSETEPFVQRYATGIRLGNAGIGGAEALTRQDRQQRFIQRIAHTCSTPAFTNVDRDINCPAIGGAGPVLTGSRN